LFFTSSNRRADFRTDSNSFRSLNTKAGLFIDNNSDFSWGMVIVEGSERL
jgi:hypothetical protein